MDQIEHNLLLADDDVDDRLFFKEALDELPLSSRLITVRDGVELMDFLFQTADCLPDVLFLDLNMPRKTGHECLSEIKVTDKLRNLPVIIFSTSFEPVVVSTLYDGGAHYYLRKPASFSRLKEVIFKAIELTSLDGLQRPSRENFVLNSD